jgi:5-methylthioadenosine/S-adenosylhomocysteine deaminase
MTLAAPEACDLLIRHGYVLTVDPERTVHPDGAIAITGSIISAVGPDAEVATRYSASRVIDARGAPVHPGMIDPHVHTTTHLSRTAFSDDPAVDSFALFAGWFNAVDDEDEHANALVVCLELMRNGFTAAMEPGTVFAPDALATAAEAVGVRISLADPFVWDLDSGGNPLASRLPRVPASAARAQSVLGRELARNRDNTGRVHAHVAVYGSGSVSEDLEVAAKRLADANGVIFNQHQNFNPTQVANDDRRLGKHALVRLAELGVLGPNTSFTHMNVLRDDEVELVVASGMSIVWHPGNFQYYGLAKSQPSRVPGLIARGVNVTPCVDAAKIWTFGDMARIAYLIARQQGDYLPCDTLFEMQTIGAARTLGLAHLIGSIEPGKRADIVIRREDLPEALPNLNVPMQILLLSQSRAVDTVICNGDIILRKGVATRIDEDVVYDRARASVRRVLGKLGLTIPPSAAR